MKICIQLGEHIDFDSNIYQSEEWGRPVRCRKSVKPILSAALSILPQVFKILEIIKEKRTHAP